MPTFLTEYHDVEDGLRVKCIGPYIVADSFEEAEVIASHLIMEPDGGRIEVLGELAESIPADTDMASMREAQKQVMHEVERIIDIPASKRALPEWTQIDKEKS